MGESYLTQNGRPDSHSETSTRSAHKAISGNTKGEGNPSTKPLRFVEGYDAAMADTEEKARTPHK